MARPLTTSDLIFSTQSQSLSATLNSLKRSTLSIHNRLKSISEDSAFVIAISEAYGLPLIANERCGSWYISPEKKTASAYFKSTDGHIGQWSFNLRRLNLQVLDVVAANGGCVIVDSTRRGKSMPDALSKTIPIWCCVLNRTIFPSRGPHPLHTPRQAVSPSERSQIEERLNTFVQQFLQICKPDVQSLAQKLKKPLRPVWVTQQSQMNDDLPPKPEDFKAVVLCTASRRVYGSEGSEGDYIQGAADDHEAWACGLTAALFWKNKDTLLNTNEEDLPQLIDKLVRDEKGSDAVPIVLSPTSNLFVSSMENLDIEPFDAVISCAPEPLPMENLGETKKTYLHLRCGAGKLGSRDLRAQLARLPSFVEALPTEIRSILVCCPTGKDLAVGVALAILCLYTDDKGNISHHPIGNKIDKTFIKQRLAWVTTSSSALNPSRGTMNALNTFLMPDPSSKHRRTAEVAAPPISNPKNTMPENAGLLMPHIPGRPETTPPTKDPPTPTYLPKTLFTHLTNIAHPWSFTRTLTSALSTHPSGTVHGTATFTPHPHPHPHSPERSSPSPTPTPPPTYLYTETGTFTTTSNLSFTVRQSYIYRLVCPEQGSEPYICVHFPPSSPTSSSADSSSLTTESDIGGLFVEMGDPEPEKPGVWGAKSRETHLCGRDLYAASWRFSRGMVQRRTHGNDGTASGTGDVENNRDKDKEDMWWEVKYAVTGPKKDYVSETRYTLT